MMLVVLGGLVRICWAKFMNAFQSPAGRLGR